MKKVFLTLFFAIVAMTNMQAQQISVVKADGSTSLYRTLADAIGAAVDGCVIYLPGGGFTIADDVKITHQVTIIGTGHKTRTDNVDGNTTISGNLYFNVGSSQSAIMGCYITGDVVIGGDGAVNDVLVRYCNVNSIQVKNNQCQETFINQNYLRSTSSFGGTNAEVTNNIMHSVRGLNNGLLSHNIILSYYTYDAGSPGYSWPIYTAINADLSKIKYNVIIEQNREVGRTYRTILQGGSNEVVSNMVLCAFGESYIIPGDGDWNNIFMKYNGGAINTTSDFHFNENYKEYESQVGIYAGTKFNDEQKAPTPYIVEKEIDEQTDAQGKLKIRISVKANQ